MSGGHFNSNGYIYFQVQDFADDLEKEIQNNNIKDEYGWCPSFNEETLAYLKKQVTLIRKMAKVMKEIDYLYSGDHGQDSFMEIIKNLEK